MRKSSFIFMLILFCAGISYAFGQDTAYQFYKKIPYPVTYFATNLAGELYTINRILA